MHTFVLRQFRGRLRITSMAPISLKIVLDDGAVTRTLMFDTTTKVEQAHQIVREKIITIDPDKEYGFFLTSADNERSGIWLEGGRTLEYYMLRDGDSLYYLIKIRNLRLRMLDGSVKTLQVDESKTVENLMVNICDRIGIPNNEEYGLCREDSDIKEESKISTGTLTLKKRTIQREKDAKLEQLSKKLKTDDNVEWLDQHKTLRESQVDPKETLLFKRRLFYSDRNVDSRDPVQLNLLYVQTRDAILDGRQVVTEDKAAEFAGIQCQVQYGDFQEDKHKPGFIENLKEFLPEQYASSWGIEKKIIKEHRKHNDISHIEAKHIYTKTARELPTYGVTFFLVKEKQKSKKKLVPRLLGINSESILRLDEETKEILQVWPLTQVKSYRAGSESFTLNFGDYSEKEYAVKTNEAFRIRDILQGYIDIIRKRLAAPYSVTHTEGEAMCEDMVEMSRGTITQNVVASKVQTHSLVGPSQIISVDQGRNSQMGTKIVTVHQVITSRQGDRSQQPMKGELNKSNSIPHDFDRKLNRLNSESVRTVVLLSDPTKENIAEVRNIVNGFKENLPSLLKGANERAANLKGETSKKLLEELDELCAYINTLITTTMKSDLTDPDNLMTAQDSAKKIADLSTQMFFSLDPKSKRRSQLLRSSRNSFILDEKTEASLRRASFITATDNACQAVKHAKDEICELYNGPPLSDEEQKRLQLKAVDKMGKLNAAIALLLNAHADDKNVDYEMAVNSMKTIDELLPGFIEDSKRLMSNGNESTNKKLRGQIIELLDGARNMCMLTGSNDVNKMHDVGNAYADVSRKLMFTFNRKDQHTPDTNDAIDLENQILAIAKDVGNKVSILLTQADELNNIESKDPHSENLDAAGAKCADATQGLLACAKLTAPTIHEPHCQSALTAAAENLSSSAQNLALAYKPLVDKPGRHGFANQLADRVFDLAKSLDKLKDTYTNLSAKNNDVSDTDESELQQKQRLQFVVTSSAAKNGLVDADKELKQIIKMEPNNATKTKNPDAQRLLSQKMAQLNAAIASLLQATSDADKPDYDTAGTAIDSICQLTPSIINDTKAIQGNVDDKSWQEITENLKDLLEATQGLCASAEDCNIADLNEAASKIGNSSGKLTFIFNPRRNVKKEDDVKKLTTLAVDQASKLLAKVDQLAKRVGGDEGTKLDTAGVQVVNAAKQLLKTAEITEQSMDDARCQAVLLSATDRLSDRIRTMEDCWKPLLQTSEYRQSGELIKHDLKQVNLTLDKLKEACQADSGDLSDIPKVKESEAQKQERLKFVVSSSEAKNALIDADKKIQDLLRKPPIPSKNTTTKNPNSRGILSDKMAQLNAALASLAQATSDADNPDYQTAGAAVNTICQLTPNIINDTKVLHGNVDDKSWQEITENLKHMLEATRGLCSNAEDCNITELNEAASKIANSSGKLTFIFNPRRNTKKADDVQQLSRSAVGETSQLLAKVNQLANSVGGDEGTKLDTAGVQVVDAAQQLLKTAEITAPSMDDARCQAVLLSATDRLSDRIRTMEDSWKPLIQTSEYRQSGELINHDLKQVNLTLDKLKEACQADSGDLFDTPNIKESEAQQKERLNFVASTSEAKNALMDADKKMQIVLKTPPIPNKSTTSKTLNAQRILSDKLAQLNAALASLIQATSDADNPDYQTAGASVNTICQLTPHIINDAKVLHGGVDDNSWQEITENLQHMLEATRGLCSNAEDCNITELNEAASKIANSSGKLTFIFNPRRNAKKEDDVLKLSRSAVDETSKLLVKVDHLANSVGGDEGTNLDTAGVQVVDAAQQLLKTAEVTAPSMDDARCQAVLLSAIDRLSNRTKNMEKCWKPLVQAPKYCQSAELLNHGLKEVDMALDKLKKVCQADAGKYEGGFIENESRNNDEKARLQFIKTLKATKSAMVDSAKEIKNADLPINKMSEKQIKKNHMPANYLLYQKLAKMNAALATLLQATSDRERPDYDEASRAISTISILTPDIIKDVKPLQSTVDDKSWRNITENLKSIVDTTCDICDNIDNPQELKESASKFANSVSKLTYVFNPRNNQKKENQILDLSRDAVEQMSLLLSNVYQLAEGVDGDDGEKLDKSGVSVVDSAQMLLKIAEITSPNINDEHCKTALLSSINQVSNLAEDLKTTWKPLVQTPKHRLIGDQLDQNHKIVRTTLDKLRTACQETDDFEETKPYQLSNLSDAKNKIKDSEKLFSEDKGYEQRAIQTGNKNIVSADKPVSERRKQLSQKLAQLNEAVAILLQAMLDRENPDCGSAEQAINIIANLTPDIVQETISLQGSMDDNSREVLFKEAKELCSASQEICSSVENNNLEELNRAATKYAQSSGKIHFIVSPRSYPNKEKKILDISRSACERTSLMLSRVSRLAESVGENEGENLNISGTRVADAAQGLLSTAQVTAPSISDRNCQSALASSADTLSDVAQDLAKIWKPLIYNPKTKQIGEQLNRDLDLLKNDLAVLKETCQDNSDYHEALEIPKEQSIPDHKKETISNTINNMQNIDMLLEDIYKSSKDEIKQNPLIIEDTPLRQLATKIMESAKAKSESNKYSADERKRFADFANKLAAAINKLDIANARCREMSFSSREKKERALQLENAILNLQIICIQSRQKDGEVSNIVNLTEFVDDVTSAVDDLHNTTKGIKQEHEKEAIMEINNKCQKIQEGALKLMNPQNTNEEGNMLDDILQIDQFAKDCEDQVQSINKKIPKIDDENARQVVKNKLHLIEERCNLLSFAAKSSISNAESATLEESLRNLDDVEKKIDVIIKSDEDTPKQETQNVTSNKQIIQATQSSLATVIAAGNENKLPKALACYATQMKSLNQTTGRNNKLKEHLDRLLDTLKMQITAKNRRVVTWQDANDEEVTKITEKILQELESYAHDIQHDVQADKEVPKINEGVQILNENDVKRLLTPNTTSVQGDEKELKAKFNQQIQKLNSMSGTTMLSSGKPESLARSLHLTAEAAAHLSTIARGLKNKDPVTNKRIEEAVQEMNIATYKLLKTSESVCQISKHPDSRRRLIEAFSLLNDSLNNLARAAVPADKMQRDCSELTRSLQLQQSFLTSENPSCSLSYADCFDAIQNQQDVINKLKSEQPMSRTECGSALRYVSSAICNSAEYASQSAYLLTLSKDDQNAAKQGLVDVPFIKKLSDQIKENCVQIICNGDADVTTEKTALNNQVQQLQEAINNASSKITVEDNKKLKENSGKLQEALKNLNKALQANTFEANTDKVTPAAMKVIDAINKINNRIDNLPQPKLDNDQKATANSKEVLDTTRNLMTKTSMMIRKASSCEKEEMTWVMFGSSDVIAAFDSLLLCIREKGAEAGLIESLQTREKLNAPVKSYLESQIQSSMFWLRKPTSNDTVKADGVKGAENIVNMAEQMYEDLHGGEKEEMKQIIVETKQLLKDCVVKYQKEKASLLMERLRELRKMLERAVVTRVVEDFLDEEPLANLETTVYKENDEKKRKFLLERKIAELLAQLGRVTKTARFVADTGNAPRHELMKTSDQVELLAPSLVKAAQQRIQTPNDKVAIEHYQKLLAEYADSLSRVRELCDKAVDPIEFSQAAGETMQRIKEESNNDPQKSLESPKVILKLCKRVVDVGMHSDLVRNDPELKKTLLDIKTAVETKPDTTRADWRDVTAEMMRRTGQVESVLGGENIFLKQPEPDQPIYAAALDLHSAVRGWSARDNEIVAVAKRTAVLMAKLSEYMNTGKKRELIFTSNSIVAESRQVAELAKKLALECSDIRIRTNLLQVCDRIPTISGQLKMLTTVKSSSLGHQGSVEDQEAMNMLVGNAQNLMISIQEVVKAAASASVKIASQRGCRIKWVQRSYY